jgi:hypothetical protein
VLLNFFVNIRKQLLKITKILAAILLCGTIVLTGMVAPASASLDDDRYEGNMYILYAGNGSLVPPRLTLAESMQRKMPAVIVFCIDDSKDCKQYSIVVSRIQEYYGRAASIIPIAVDSIPIKANYSKDEVGYYYKGFVPQTVILDQQGKVVFDGKGQVSFETSDNVLRKVFDLLPRSESTQLKRRTVNEFNSELVDN